MNTSVPIFFRHPDLPKSILWVMLTKDEEGDITICIKDKFNYRTNWHANKAPDIKELLSISYLHVRASQGDGARN